MGKLNAFIALFAVLFCTAVVPLAGQKRVIVILGDSLTEGYGIAKDHAYPKLVEDKLRAAGENVEIVNGGISGSTTASGPGRLKWFLKRKPQTVVLALGANDGLRGVDVADTRKNLEEMAKLATDAGAEVFVAGMMLPPNYGFKNVQAFNKIFPEVAKKYHAKLIPFLLEGVAGHTDLNQADSIHPNERGHEIVATLVANALRSSPPAAR